MKQVHYQRGAIAAAMMALAVFGAVPNALAGTATNLNCAGCVDTRDIGKGQVKARNLHKSAKPTAVAASVQTGIVSDATDTTKVIAKVTVQAPGPGAIVATATVVADRADGGFFCKIDTAISPIVQAPDELYFGYRASDSSKFATVTGQNVFAVTAGKVVVYLLCQRFSSLNTPRLANVVLTALFTPNAQAIDKNSPAASASGRKIGRS